MPKIGAKDSSGEVDVRTSRTVTSRFGKTVLAVVAAAFIFSVGVGVGDGRISLGFNPNPSGTLPQQLDYASVDNVYDTLRRNYDGQLDQNALLAGLKDGLAEATGDPYTEYFTPQEAKEFEQQVNNEFSGIGAELGQDKDKNLIVVAPISGTPAARAGVRPQDIIAEINGQSTSGKSVEEAIKEIRGEKGTEVKLKLVRNRSQTLDLTIVRDDIRIPSVEAKTLDGNIGYIRINTFAPDTGGVAANEAKRLREAGVKSVVLDLRGNPGGLVDAAIQVASIWLPQGKFVMQEKRGEVIQTTYTAQGRPALEGVQTIVLVDGGSASASEIVAGALRDHNAAKIYGEKSYGKGSVQKPIGLRDGGELKVTIGRWYRPNGQNIDKRGIQPDKTIKVAEADIVAGKDVQLDTAAADLR